MSLARYFEIPCTPFLHYFLSIDLFILVRSLQRSEGDVSDPIKYTYILLISIPRRIDLAMSVCPSVSTQTSTSVLKLSV